MKGKPHQDKTEQKKKKSSSNSKPKVSELNKQLAIAIKNNEIKIVKELLKTKVNVNNLTGSKYGNTPLIIACYNKNFEIAKLLIEAGADVNKKAKGGKTALWVTCDAYEPKPIDKLVELLLVNGAEPNISKKGDDGPLHYACMYGKNKAAIMLIEHGADVNAKGGYNRTPLIYTATNGKSPELVKVLLENGADIHATNEAGENAFFEMITQGNTNIEIAKILLKNGISVNSKSKHYGMLIHWAAFCGRTEIVKLLLDKGADINAKDKMGNTPILRAMSQNKIETVKLLFNSGADPLTMGPLGFNLLEYATDKGDKEFVKQIATKIKNDSKKGLNALTTAARKGDLPMLKLLIEAGFDVNDKDSFGSESPLIKASYYGKKEVVEYLLEQGADIKATDYRGNTALLNAAYNGHTNVVEILLKNGAEINERNKLNWNALMQACVEGHFVTAKFLLENGSPTNEIDMEKGATALTLAKYSGSKNLIKLLESYGAKERSIKMRKANEPYFSLFDCQICQYLPDRKDLARTELPEKFEGLETIYINTTNSDRYSDDTRKIMKCKNCGTYYHQFHTIDTEDAFISGPYISQDFQRINLVWLKTVLKHIKKADEAKEFDIRYPYMIEELKGYLPVIAKVNPNNFSFIVESILDYYIKNNDWESIKKELLTHKETRVVFKTANDLIIMYGESSWKGNFPRFTSYKSISEPYQLEVRKFMKDHLKDFKKLVDKYKQNKNDEIRNNYESLIKSAKYYKVFK